jgi:5,10-methylenetetrahydromethanopterin reductase
MHAACANAGREPAELYASAAISGCVLRPGEGFDSSRLIAQTGAHATMLLHAMVEQDEFGALPRAPLPSDLQPLLERYREIYRQYEPSDARDLCNHRGHLMYLRSEERELCTPGLIQGATWTAPRDELRDRLRQVTGAGYRHVAVNFGLNDARYLEECADVFSAV